MLIYRHELIQLGQQKNGQADMDRYGAHKIGSCSFCPDDGKSLAAFAQSGLVLVRANMDPSGHNSIKKFLEIVENAVTNNDAVMKNEASPMQQCRLSQPSPEKAFVSPSFSRPVSVF